MASESGPSRHVREHSRAQRHNPMQPSPAPSAYSSITNPTSEPLNILDLPPEVLGLILQMALWAPSHPAEEKGNALERKNSLASREVCRLFRHGTGIGLQAEWGRLQTVTARTLGIPQRMMEIEQTFPLVPQQLLGPYCDHEQNLLRLSWWKELAREARIATTERKIPFEDGDIISLAPRVEQAIEAKALEALGTALRKKFPRECRAQTPTQVSDWCLDPDNQQALAAATDLDISYAEILDLPIEIVNLLGRKQAIENRSLDILCSSITAQYPEIVFPEKPEEQSDWFLIPENQAMLQQVTRLKLNDLDLESLPKEIGLLGALKELNLCGNLLTTLPREIGNLGSLLDLTLAENSLTILPREIGNLGSLLDLDLSQNSLTTLPREIGNLGSLQDLNLAENLLAILPREIGYLGALIFLTLNNNPLETLPNEIGHLSALKQLNLPNNNLSTLPKEISNLAALNQLLLQNNQLSTLPLEIADSVNPIIRENPDIKACFERMAEQPFSDTAPA